MGTRILPDSYEIDVALQLTVEDDFSYRADIRDFMDINAKMNCVCKDFRKWLVVFGVNFPFLRVNNKLLEGGKIEAIYCPLCGARVEESYERNESKRESYWDFIENLLDYMNSMKND